MTVNDQLRRFIIRRPGRYFYKFLFIETEGAIIDAHKDTTVEELRTLIAALPESAWVILEYTREVQDQLAALGWKGPEYHAYNRGDNTPVSAEDAALAGPLGERVPTSWIR